MGTTLSDVPVSLLDEMVARLESQSFDLLPDDVTVSRMIERTGKQRNEVVRFLNKMVEAGELVKIQNVYDPKEGKKCNAYRKPVV